MAQEPQQNYENHRTFDKYYYVIAIIFLLAAIISVIAHFRGPEILGLATLLMCGGTLGLALRARIYSTTVQDRIIRLEMRLRLEKILPEDLREEAAKLDRKLLIGLRFASDEEMADLVRKVLEEKITSPDAIKKLVKNWQADHLRV